MPPKTGSSKKPAVRKAHILDSPLAEVLGAVFPDDVGFKLIFTCNLLYRNQDLWTTLMAHSKQRAAILCSYITNCKNDALFERLLFCTPPSCMGEPRISLKRRKSSKPSKSPNLDPIRHAVQAKKHNLVRLMANRGAKLTDKHPDDAILFNELVESFFPDEDRYEQQQQSCTALFLAKQKCKADGSFIFLGKPTTEAKEQAKKVRSSLHAATYAPFPEVIRYWTEHDPASVLGFMDVQQNPGRIFSLPSHHTPFTSACARTRLFEGGHEFQRKLALECAVLLGNVPGVNPTTEGGEEYTYLHWACWAGVPDVVRKWLQHKDVTAEWLATNVVDFRSNTTLLPFLCKLLYQTGESGHQEWNTDKEVAAKNQWKIDAIKARKECILLVATCGKYGAASLDNCNRSPLYDVCAAGLDDVLSAWMGDAQGRAAVLKHLAERRFFGGAQGDTPFTVACKTSMDDECLSMQSEGARACAVMLAALPECQTKAFGRHTGGLAPNEEFYRIEDFSRGLTHAAWAKRADITLGVPSSKGAGARAAGTKGGKAAAKETGRG